MALQKPLVTTNGICILRIAGHTTNVIFVSWPSRFSSNRFAHVNALEIVVQCPTANINPFRSNLKIFRCHPWELRYYTIIKGLPGSSSENQLKYLIALASTYNGDPMKSTGTEGRGTFAKYKLRWNPNPEGKLMQLTSTLQFAEYTIRSETRVENVQWNWHRSYQNCHLFVDIPTRNYSAKFRIAPPKIQFHYWNSTHNYWNEWKTNLHQNWEWRNSLLRFVFL